MLIFVVLLSYGTVVHVVQLVGSGGEPYPHLPRWLVVYFVSLTLWDPLAAVLLARRHRVGVLLAVAVFVTDAAANAVANYGYDASAGVALGRVSQAGLTVLAVAAVASAPAMWRPAAGNGADGRRRGPRSPGSQSPCGARSSGR